MVSYDEPFDGNYGKNMRFTKAEIYTFRPVKLARPFCDATCGPFEYLFFDQWLRLYESDGTYGECACSPIMAKTLLPLLLTGETLDYSGWYHKLYWSIRNNGFMSESVMELGKLDWALHDIMSKRAAMPLHRFLGATRDFANAYWSGCGTNLTRDQLVEELRWGIDRGYQCFKMKVGTDFGALLDEDISRIALARETIGKDAELAVDINQLMTWEQALEFAERIEQYDIAWIEEPVHSHDLLGLRELTKRSGVAIAMGESMRSAYLHAVYAEFGVKHLQPGATGIAGIRDLIAVRDIAEQKGIRLSSGGFTPAYAAMALATATEETLVEYLYPVTMAVKEFMAKYPREKEGSFFLSTKPGASISLDTEKVEKDGWITRKAFYNA